jgi:hypothetical protein
MESQLKAAGDYNKQISSSEESCLRVRTMSTTCFMLEKIVSSLQRSSPNIRESVIQLAVEIAREGREGRRIGTIFTLADAQQVLARSRPLMVADPFRKPSPCLAPSALTAILRSHQAAKSCQTTAAKDRRAAASRSSLRLMHY